MKEHTLVVRILVEDDVDDIRSFLEHMTADADSGQDGMQLVTTNFSVDVTDIHPYGQRGGA